MIINEPAAVSNAVASVRVPESERPIIQCVNTLFPAAWPSAVPPEYGEADVKHACDKFLMPYSNDLKQEYRDFKDAKGSVVCGEQLKGLVGAIHTLPVSTAECERGFSKMNVICSPLRTSLTAAHISFLIFISAVGPPLHVWKPLPYVQSWLDRGRQAATDLAKSKAPKPGSDSDERKALWNCL